MSETLHCAAFGVPFQLIAGSSAMLARMKDCAPFSTCFSAPGSGDAIHFSLLPSPDGSGYRLLNGSGTTAESSDPLPLRIRLARDLMLHVAGNAPDHVFLHAGVVGWRGRALLLPGPSFAGKTTLVAGLVRAGAAYYSDEYAVLDHAGRVHPYPRELQMRRPGSPEQTPTPVADLDGAVGVGALPVAHVAFAHHSPSGRWDPRPVSAGMAVLEMLRHAIPVQRAPARVMATLAKVMETASASRSPRGEASLAAAALLSSMESQHR